MKTEDQLMRIVDKLEKEGRITEYEYGVMKRIQKDAANRIDIKEWLRRITDIWNDLNDGKTDDAANKLHVLMTETTIIR